MNDYINILPYKEALVYLLIGALLHAVFYILTKFIIPILIQRESAVVLYWQRLQILVWITFFVFFFSSLLIKNIVLTLAVSVIVVATGWTYWTNFFAGTIIKFRNTPRLHDFISTDIVKGRIRAINLTYTEVVNTKGELIIIPNNKLNKSVIKHVNTAKTLNPFVYEILFKKESLTYDSLYQKAMNCPYFTGNQKISLDRISRDVYAVKAMLIDESFKEKAIEYFEAK